MSDPSYVLNLYGPIIRETGGFRHHLRTFGPYPSEAEAKKAKTKIRAGLRRLKQERCSVSIDPVTPEIPENPL